MIKRITLYFCLCSFFPVAVGAQELSLQGKGGSLSDPAAAGSALQSDRALSPNREERQTIALNEATPTPAADREARKGDCGGLRNWAEIHWGGYRWIWWAGAAAALIGLHVAVAH